MKKIIPVLIVVFAFFTNGSAQESTKEALAQNVYLVKTTHTVEQCLQALDELKATKSNLLEKMYFGCKHGDHTSYGFLKGTTEAEVRAMLPKSMQETASVAQVDRITAKDVEAYHQK